MPSTEELRLGSILGLPAGSCGVLRCKADGDCFYEAVSHATSGFDVRGLRALAANEATDETLSTMRACQSAGVEGYDHVKGMACLEDLRSAICRTAKEGKDRCVWADDFAVQALANKLNTSFLILNDESCRGRGSARGDAPGFVAIHPHSHNAGSQSGDQQLGKSCVVLHRTRRKHYNPGHHAGRVGVDVAAGGCGFCVLNTAAIAAAHALEKHGGVVRKVAIVDVDVHHGNGTQDILRHRNDEEVLYASTHYYDVHDGLDH